MRKHGWGIALALAVLAAPLGAGVRGCVQVKIAPPRSNLMTSFNVYVAEAQAGPFRKANAVPVTGTSYLACGLDAGRTYWFSVTSLSGGVPPVESARSQAWPIHLSLSAEAAGAMPRTAATAEGGIRDGCIEPRGWAPPAGLITGYNLYVSERTGSGFSKANAEPITGASYRLCGLEPGRRYYMHLTAWTGRDQVESRPSGEWSEVAHRPGVAPETWTPQRRAFRGVDFEAEDLFEIGTNFGAPGMPVTAKVAAGAGHSGRHTCLLQGRVDKGGWGMLWVPIRGPGPGPDGLDCAGSKEMVAWIYARKSGPRFSVGFREYGPGGKDEKAEVWQSKTVDIRTERQWTRYAFPLREMTEENFNEDCKPDCLKTGDNRMQLDRVRELYLWFEDNGAPIDLFLDDFHFE